jgi:hypothetical protein
MELLTDVRLRTSGWPCRHGRIFPVGGYKLRSIDDRRDNARIGKRVSPQDDIALRRLTAARVVVHDIGVIFSSGADSEEKHEHAIDITLSGGHLKALDPQMADWRSGHRA